MWMKTVMKYVFFFPILLTYEARQFLLKHTPHGVIYCSDSLKVQLFHYNLNN